MGRVLRPPGVHHDARRAARGARRRRCFLAFARRLPRGARLRDPTAAAVRQRSPGETRDAARSTARSRTLVRECPEQYLWGYNRYKVPSGRDLPSRLLEPRLRRLHVAGALPAVPRRSRRSARRSASVAVLADPGAAQGHAHQPREMLSAAGARQKRERSRARTSAPSAAASSTARHPVVGGARAHRARWCGSRASSILQALAASASSLLAPHFARPRRGRHPPRDASPRMATHLLAPEGSAARPAAPRGAHALRRRASYRAAGGHCARSCARIKAGDAFYYLPDLDFGREGVGVRAVLRRAGRDDRRTVVYCPHHRRARRALRDAHAAGRRLRGAVLPAVGRTFRAATKRPMRAA